MNESRLQRHAMRIAQAGARTYTDVLADVGGRPLKAPSDARGGSPLAVLYTAPPYALKVPSLPAARLAVNLTRSEVSGGIDGERPRRFDARRYSLFLTPPGAPVTWQKELPSRHLLIYFHPDVLQGADDIEGLRDGVPPLFNASIPGLSRLADDLVGELLAPRMLSDEVADSVGRLMLVAVLRHLSLSGVQSRALTPSAMKHLREYVWSNLGERLLVADLAREVGLPLHRFAQAFTQLTAQPPHRYVLSMRIERALLLLATKSTSLVEIAHECGFASQQHMTTAIRRHVGTTPKRYRMLSGR